MPGARCLLALRLVRRSLDEDGSHKGARPPQWPATEDGKKGRLDHLTNQTNKTNQTNETNKTDQVQII